MKRERPSYAFMMEMIWVCAFFLICACIFVLAFVKAEQLSHNAEILNQAVQAASNAMEGTFAEGQAIDAGIYDTNDYTLEIETSEDNGLLSVVVRVVSAQDGSILYTLEGAHAIPKGGAA